MQSTRRRFLKDSLILIGTSAIPYIGWHVVSRPELDSNPFKLQFLKRNNETIVLSSEDIQLISSFDEGKNEQKVYDLIKSDYEIGRTVFINSFLFSITEAKITKYRRDKQCKAS